MILDVVYNHFGPSGAYAPLFAPYLSDRHTPWGRAVNLDGPHSDGVRRYIIDSVLMWLRDYHVDGLRLDAVHAMPDTRAVHLLEELAVEVESLSTHLGRPLSLIAESDLNDPRLIASREAGGYGLHAQWNDDAHHALHTLLTGEQQGYYGDFGTMECLAEVLTRRLLPHRHLVQLPPPPTRPPGRPAHPRPPLRGLPAEPRPDRQPRGW